MESPRTEKQIRIMSNQTKKRLFKRPLRKKKDKRNIKSAGIPDKIQMLNWVMAFLEETFYLFCLRLPQSVGVKNNQAHVRPLPVILLHLIKAFKVPYTRLCFFLRGCVTFIDGYLPRHNGRNIHDNTCYIGII